MHTNPDKKAAQIRSLRMPKALAKQVTEAAADQGISENTLICLVLAEALGFPLTVDYGPTGQSLR
jgi:predicted HicB family RNase H-like nuclease